MNDNDTLETGIRLTGVDSRYKRPATVLLEALIILHDNTELLGLYTQLLFFQQIEILNHVVQEELASMLGLSYPTFNKYKTALEQLGLISLEGGKLKVVYFNDVRQAEEYKWPVDPKEKAKYLKKLKGMVVPVTPELLLQETKQQQETEAKLRVDAIIQEAVKNAKQKEKAKAKREEQRFPNEDYDIVLTAYKKYKGVGLLGPEVVRAKRAIKQMFLAQRSIKQIVDCMKFFHDNQRNEEMRWLQSWTLETVMKKMPEFVAGKLKVRTMDDDYEDA